MVKRFIGSGRNKEGGYLATHKQDFDAHVTGGDFRHGALDIDMEPSISLYAGNFDAPTVQETLEKVTQFIYNAGQGFLTIGDGYDTAQPANFIVGSLPTPTLESAFAAAFLHPRMQQGGIILVKAGTYKLENTVEVPNGITIMGEGRGTVIIGHMSFNTLPMFLIKTANQFLDIGNGSPSPIPVFNSASKNKLYNIVLGDNTDNYITSGGVPVPTMTGAPMVAIESGANFSCEEVTFLGKFQSSAPSPQPVTYSAIGTVSGSATPTTLSVNNCYIDGCGIGIEFLPSAPGDGNNLIVDKCRARLFGKTSTDFENNCFIYFNTTNGSFSNNYIIFDTNVAPSSPCFIKKTNISTNKIPKLNIIGNYGGKTNESQDIQLLVDSSSNTDIEYSLVGNTIANRPQNEWCITVGGGVGSTAMGDINGVGALDFIIQYMQDIHATVLLHAGTYNVNLSSNPASSTYSKLKLIGIKKGNYYPTVKLNLDSSCSTVNFESGSLYTLCLANEIKSVHFQSSNHSNYNSISLCYQQPTNSANGCLKAEDCLFTDVLLFCPEFALPSVDPVTGEQTYYSVFIKDCQFLQTTFFIDDYLSLILPQYKLIVIDNCIFRGKGYIGGIGQVYCVDYNYNDDSQVILNNCIMDITGGTITTPPLTTGNLSSIPNINSYFGVYGTKINLELKNCKITASNDLNAAYSTIGSGLLDGSAFSLANEYFNNFIFIKSNSLSIDNCIFNGPEQEWTDPTNTYALTTLLIDSPSVSIDKCKFAGGALPLQIAVNYSEFTDRKLGINCNILNSNFRGAVNGKSFCLLSINNPEYPGTSSQIKPIITIDNCEFNTYNTSSSYPSYFIYRPNTSSSEPIGCVMVDSINSNVFFSKSIINAKLLKSTSSSQYAALYINNFTTPLTIFGTIPSDIFVNNNKIYLENPSSNGLDSSSTNDFVFSCYCKGGSININNNTITMNNYGINNLAPTCNYAGHLYIIAAETNPSINIASSIISNNIFNKLNFVTYSPGSRSTIKKTSVKIDYENSANSRGLIIDNIFTSPYLDENLTPNLETTDNTNLIEIDVALTNWTAERNKNQTKIMNISPEFGNHTVGTSNTGLPPPPFLSSSSTEYFIRNANNTGIDIYTYLLSPSIDPYTGHKNLRIKYFGGTLGATSFKKYSWRIPLSEALPKNVTIKNIKMNTSSSGSAPTGTCYTLFEISDNNNSQVSSSIDWTALFYSTSISLSPSATYINNENNPTLKVTSVFNTSATTFVIIIQPIIITYRW